MKSTTTFLLPVLAGFVAVSYAHSDTQVYLHPFPARAASDGGLTLDPQEASHAVARFVGLDLFERYGDGDVAEMDIYYGGDEVRLGGNPANRVELDFDDDVGPFVAMGMGRSLVIGVDGEGDMNDVIPQTLPLTLTASTASPSRSFTFSWSSLSLSTLTERASQLYHNVWSSPSLSQRPSEPTPKRLLDIFDLPNSPASKAFLDDLAALAEFVDQNDASSRASPDGFGAFDLTSLRPLAAHYGQDSAEYRAAASAIRAAISSAMAQPNLKLVVLTVPLEESFGFRAKRQQPPDQTPLPDPSPKPHDPISAISTCHATLDACINSTNSCSNHGQCVGATKAGKTCFVCTCSPTRSINEDGKTQTTLWAGDQCERIDVSAEFTLLAGTVIALLILVFGSIAVLSGIGDEKLPQVLAEGNVPTSKRD